MTTNIFTTNGANIYSIGLNLANAFKKESRKIIPIVLIISAALTLTKPYEIDSLFKFLGFLGNVIPPLPGIILADYSSYSYSSRFWICSVKWNNIRLSTLHNFNDTY